LRGNEIRHRFYPETYSNEAEYEKRGTEYEKVV
jgi:hypothetical protein